MAATLTEERFTGPDWVFERKYDGIRLLAFRHGKDVRLYSRNRLQQNCPPVATAIGNLPVREVILDGEITWDFRTYYIFDIVWLDGRDLSKLPLAQRRELLETLPFEPPLHRVARLHGEKPWERANLQ